MTIGLSRGRRGADFWLAGAVTVAASEAAASEAAASEAAASEAAASEGAARASEIRSKRAMNAAKSQPVVAEWMRVGIGLLL
jgi:hypothetical protein